MAEPSAEVPAASVPDGAWLLDVREDDEWTAGHAPGATHIPLGQLGDRGAEVPGTRPSTYLPVGRALGQGRLALVQSGWSAVNVAGRACRTGRPRAVPMITDSGAEPFVA